MRIDPLSLGTIYAGWGYSGVAPGGFVPPGGILKSTDSGTTWRELSGGPSLAVGAIAIDARLTSRIYAGTLSGFWRSTDAGETWMALSEGLPQFMFVQAIEIDPQDKNTLYAGILEAPDSGGVFKLTLGPDRVLPISPCQADDCHGRVGVRPQTRVVSPREPPAYSLTRSHDLAAARIRGSWPTLRSLSSERPVPLPGCSRSTRKMVHACGEDYYSDWRRWDSFPSRIEKTFLQLLDVLEEGGRRATIFFLGWVARNRPQLVREAVRRGHEAAVHGDRHRRADEMTLAEFREDLRRARASIEDAAGAACTTHRAAEWSIRHPADPALAILWEEGFRCDASATPVPPLGRYDNPSPLSGGGDRRRNR